ncbi:non-ribosomal peptide synthetase [Nonomuraea dietziae]|uniref:non-ribosomal peptide synthetase n=1 Tax=Nonomuraea dietziae TaxID=65515 RepID=UPI0033D83E8C
MTTLELLRRRRASAPRAVAVSGVDGELTYDELLGRADALAGLLREHGVRPGVPVGLCMPRTTGMVVALLAVWTAGGAYVPLDPGFPAGRLRLMREDAGAGLVLTQEGVDPSLLAGASTTLTLTPGGEAATARRLPLVEEHGDLAYLIYTSGSTGRPKGVAVTHRAVTNLIESFTGLLGLSSRDVWLAVTTLSFDISVLELLLPLACGARVALASAAEAADGRALRARALAEGATVMQAAPSGWRILLEAGVPEGIGLRLSGGEALPRDLADRLLEGGARLLNVYGPTETTVWSTAGDVAQGAGPVDLGLPIANTYLYILGPDGRPVPPGEQGELHIGGDGLARGYHGLPALTAARFLPDPFSSEPGARMYATGDLATRAPDGRLHYLGRADQQVKIRGFRIELGEVESALRAAPEVRQAAARVHEGPDGQPRLVAHVVPNEPCEAEELWPALRERLRAALPEYMVPGRLVVMAALPLTPGGKLDRNALPPPDWSRAVAAVYRAPATPVEAELAELWAEVLGLGEPVGVDDDFFDLGGHSLAAGRIIARIQSRFAVEAPILALFENPTVAGLARELDRLDDSGLDLTTVAALHDQLDGLSAEDLDALFDELAQGS